MLITRKHAAVVLVAGFTRDAIGASIGGRLAHTADGCLGTAGQGETVTSVVVVFPAGTEVVEGSPLTLGINGEDVEIGHAFTGGGELSEPENIDVVPSGPSRCLDQSVFLLSRKAVEVATTTYADGTDETSLWF